MSTSLSFPIGCSGRSMLLNVQGKADLIAGPARKVELDDLLLNGFSHEWENGCIHRM
jgi:hypothetical protein